MQSALMHHSFLPRVCDIPLWVKEQRIIPVIQYAAVDFLWTNVVPLHLSLVALRYMTL